MNNIILVFVGGGLGAAGRYWLHGMIERSSTGGFPYGTFIVNLIGCILIGIIMSAFEGRFLANPSLRTFLAIGILGGFTTFSAFSYETVSMMYRADYLYATANIFLSVFFCLVGTYIGLVVGKLT